MWSADGIALPAAASDGASHQSLQSFDGECNHPLASSDAHSCTSFWPESLSTARTTRSMSTLIDLPPRNYELPKVRLTNDQMWATFALSAVVLPAALLVAGLVVWRRRQ